MYRKQGQQDTFLGKMAYICFMISIGMLLGETE